MSSMSEHGFDEPFFDRLATAVIRCRTPVLVGLDPRLESLPAGLRPSGNDSADVAAAYERFCRGVIDVVAGRVAAVKPQAAFFEELGPAGMQALAGVVRYARSAGLLVILDGKRNDIGSTAIAYARGYLGAESPWQCDALTVSPYLGADSLEPFLGVARERNCGVFVLVKTSNPGGGMLQDLRAEEKAVYEHVADFVESAAAESLGRLGYGPAGAVVGATYPEQLAALRERMPHTWFLVPGFGAQGATADDVAAAFDSYGLGAIVNSSRGIIFAHRRSPYAERYGDERWQEAVSAALDEMISQLPGAVA